MSSGLTNEMERYRFEPVDARYVRLLCNGNSTNKWNSPTEIRIRFEEVNAIDNIQVDEKVDGEFDDASSFDIAGRRVPVPTRKGLYIIGGRKVYVR